MEEKSNSMEDHPNNGGWQTVTYLKKNQKQKLNSKNPSSLSSLDSSQTLPNNNNGKDNVSKSLEKISDEQRRKTEAQIAYGLCIDDDLEIVRPSKNPSEKRDDMSNLKGKENANVEKKKKKKKEKDLKKQKVTVPEAAAKINSADLAVFLADVTTSYESQEDIQLMRFADYFGRAFSAVNASQFPWLKLFRESTVESIAEIPFCHIPKAVYKTSADWIDQCSDEAIGSFVMWSLNRILTDLAIQQAGSRGTKKGAQNISSKSQISMVLIISMVLRRKPDVLIKLLPVLRDNSKYLGQDKLPVIIWMIVQASQGDLTVGLYLWAHHVLPMLGGKSSSNPQTRDLVLQLGERITSAPNARKVLAKGAVRNGERLIPPSAVEILLRFTFPASSARVKATDRFEAIYPTVVYVALAGTPRSKGVKQFSQQIQPVLIKAAGEGNPELSEEAAKIFIWCLIQNPECYKHWEKIYANNVEASVVILRRLTRGWGELSSKLSALDTLHDTLKIFRKKNEKASSGGVDAARRAIFKDADKYCKELLKKIFVERYRMVILIFVCSIWVALGIAFYYIELRET